jgi:hypothetical protein
MRWTLAIALLGLMACADTAPEDGWRFQDTAPTEPEPAASEPNETVEEPGDEPTTTPPEEPGGDPVEPPPPAQAFPDAIVGLWLVDQPYHAGYEASWYDFKADGSLVEVKSESFGHEVPTGTVGRCEEWSPQNDDHCAEFDNAGECMEYYPRYCTIWSEESCTFGDAWWATAAGSLTIASVCNDGTERDIVFDMAALLEGDAEAPLVVSVGGEEGWFHNMWDWRWLRCEDHPEFPECRTFGS